MHKKYDYKYEDMVPSDVKFSNYRPAINKIWLSISNKQHYIVWVDLLEKQETFIDLPKIGEEIKNMERVGIKS